MSTRLAALATALVLVAGCSFDRSGLHSPPSPSLEVSTIGISLDGRANDAAPKPALDGGSPKPDSGSGNDGCVATVACMEACHRDESCRQGCLSHGSASGNVKAQALETCWDQSENSCTAQCVLAFGASACFDCIHKPCATQLAGCFGPIATAAKSCSEILDCYAHGSDDVTYFRCYFLGSAAARAKMDAVVQCAAQADTDLCFSDCTGFGASCWDCESSACSAEQQACRELQG
jgi:hypothetical protein